jgi:carbonic anhydrase
LRQFHFHLPSEHLDNGTSIASMSLSAPFFVSHQHLWPVV